MTPEHKAKWDDYIRWLKTAPETWRNKVFIAADDEIAKVADLTAERNSLALQLDSCQGALREVIAENSANCDRADKAEQDFRHQRAAYQMCSESREEIEAKLTEAQEELRRLKELT